MKEKTLREMIREAIREGGPGSGPQQGSGKSKEPSHADIIDYIEKQGYGGDAIQPDGNPTPETYQDAKDELMYSKQKGKPESIPASEWEKMDADEKEYHTSGQYAKDSERDDTGRVDDETYSADEEGA